ncbi:MAG: MATE family efflux transporter, partial [Hungatella hathewayi]|nr:MATE family efflux transporter [Hungatella hathewayi]
KKGYMTAVGVMFVWGLFCSGVLIGFPKQIFGLFIHEADIIPMGISYLVILGFSQMFMCVELTTVGALSGLGKTLLCSVISVVFTSARIPLAMILSSSPLALDGIWWAFTISSVMKGILFFICFLYVSGKLPEDGALASW